MTFYEGTNAPDSGRDFALSASNVRFVKFNNLTNYGGTSIVGLAEIRFVGSPVGGGGQVAVRVPTTVTTQDATTAIKSISPLPVFDAALESYWSLSSSSPGTALPSTAMAVISGDSVAPSESISSGPIVFQSLIRRSRNGVLVPQPVIVDG